MPIRRPGRTDRITIVGRTGTGKTVAGLYHLLYYPLEEMCWVIIDVKGEESFDEIDAVQRVDFDYIPNEKENGIFWIDANYFAIQDGHVDQYLAKLWARENIGIFCDECYVLGNSPALNLCLTQGRSKHIPMILCTQRPVNCSRYAFSEASFVQVFDLNDQRDIDTIESFVPIEWDEEEPLRKHESFYYDIAENEVVRFAPVPPPEELIGSFNERLPRKRVRI